MKWTITLLWAGIILWFGGLRGGAQIIYSNAFNGGAVNLSGTAPTATTNYAGGLSSATWNDVLGANDPGAFYANGTVGTGEPDSVLLPFTPQSGYIYTLTASLTFSGNPGNWIGFGFAQSDPVNESVGDARFADSGVNGYDWIILTESTGGVQYFSGPRGNTPQIYAANGFTGGAQTITAQVILNTMGSLWSIAAYVNGGQMGSTYTYGGNPPIGALGITQTSLSAPANCRWN